MTMNYCQNCDWHGPDEELKPIQDLLQRADPGEPMPSGECPKCGCLCQPVEEDDDIYTDDGIGEDEDDLEDEDLEYDEGEDDFESSDSVDVDGGPDAEVGCPDARMITGYAHQWFNDDDTADDMEIIVHNPSFTERPIRIQNIDGSPHVVFWSSDLQCFLAQTCVSLGVPT